MIRASSCAALMYLVRIRLHFIPVLGQIPRRHCGKWLVFDGWDDAVQPAGETKKDQC